MQFCVCQIVNRLLEELVNSHHQHSFNGSGMVIVGFHGAVPVVDNASMTMLKLVGEMMLPCAMPLLGKG